MTTLRQIWAVLRFEWLRSLTPWRLFTAGGLAAFPAVLVALQVFALDADLSDARAWDTVATLFYTIPGVVCLMGLLLWATPALSAELEGRTWSYVAIRPGATRALLIGKYLHALLWTIPTAWLSLTLCLLIAQPHELWRLFFTFAAITCFSAVAYGALFLLFGVLFLRRSMFVAAGYTVVMEVIVSFFPATINKFTVQYRLRTMLSEWLELPVEGERWLRLFDVGPAWQQGLILFAAAAILVTLAVLIAQYRELAGPEQL